MYRFMIYDNMHLIMWCFKYLSHITICLKEIAHRDIRQNANTCNMNSNNNSLKSLLQPGMDHGTYCCYNHMCLFRSSDQCADHICLWKT